MSANFVTVEVLLVMVRLTEVQRGQAIALLMQGQRQQQVARHFGVHVSDVVGNGLPTLAFSRGIDMGEGRLWYGEGFRMV